MRNYRYGYWCDKCQQEVDSRGDLVKGTRFDDDECLHGLCHKCYDEAKILGIDVKEFFHPTYTD